MVRLVLAINLSNPRHQTSRYPRLVVCLGERNLWKDAPDNKMLPLPAGETVETFDMGNLRHLEKLHLNGDWEGTVDKNQDKLYAAWSRFRNMPRCSVKYIGLYVLRTTPQPSSCRRAHLSPGGRPKVPVK
jgi:hypothetical protein